MASGTLNSRCGSWLLFFALAMTAVGCESERDPIPAAALAPAKQDQITLTTADGQSVRPLAMEAGHRATVLIFVAAECPICNAYAGEINRLSQGYSTSGVRFLLVDVDTNLSAADAAKHGREYALAPAILLDPKHVLVQKFSATTTPEVILIDQTGSILYRGRIDDQYIRLGQRRFEAGQHDLRDALDAVIAGRSAPVAATPPVGCAI